MNDREIAVQTLELMSPSRSASYESWIKVGMALYHAGASVSDWSNWHPDGAKNHEKECLSHWKTFARQSGGTKCTVGSLIKWAKEDSGKDPRGSSDGAPNEILGWDETFSASTPTPTPGGWDRTTDLRQYLQAVFMPGDLIGYVADATENAKGKLVPHGWGIFGMPYEQFLKNIDDDGVDGSIGVEYNKKAGIWVRHNPLDGEGPHCKNVTDFRHVLVENDDLPQDQQLAILRYLQLPCSATLDAGNKSIHALVRIDAGTDRKLYDERVAYLYNVLKVNGYKVDTACRNPSRLSRLPGFYRGDRRQFLISTNTGAASWGEWVDIIEKKNRSSESFESLLGVDLAKEDDSLISPRFFTTEGSWMIVSQSGIGKSSLVMQMAVCATLGKEFFGLRFKRQMRVMLVQAENNRLDLSEPIKGIAQGLELSAGEIKKVSRNMTIISEDTHAGRAFCDWLDRAITAYQPVDIVIIDPLLAYAGCDLNRQGDVSLFLRNQLNPIVHKHKIGIIVVHHTPKIKKKKQDDDYDLAYIGTGSAELTNWARAVSVIEKDGEDTPLRATFSHVKRGTRLAKRSISISHASDGSIFWMTDKDKTRENTFAEELRKVGQCEDVRIEKDGIHAGAQALKNSTGYSEDDCEKAWRAATVAAKKIVLSKLKGDRYRPHGPYAHCLAARIINLDKFKKSANTTADWEFKGAFIGAWKTVQVDVPRDDQF